MQIRYAVSLWNYGHYANVPSLERVLALLRDQGYGVELWGAWQEERDLFDLVGRARLKHALAGMEVSLHTAGANTLELHQKQVDAAAYLGAEVVVIHSDDLFTGDTPSLDIALARKVVSYASRNGVRIALENGKLPVLMNAIQNVEGLSICLDVGHVYLVEGHMSEFLDALKGRLIHLHLQDILPEAESHLPLTGRDHFIPGTGGIPREDWELLITTLEHIDFQGMAVFEIQPRNPLQTALLGRTFVQRLIEKQ